MFHLNLVPKVRKEWSYSSFTHTSEYETRILTMILIYVSKILLLSPEKQNKIKKAFIERVREGGILIGDNFTNWYRMSVSDSKYLEKMGVIIRERGRNSSHRSACDYVTGIRANKISNIT